ncbi:MAG: AraC family ligand binding domain-containing protein, partial [Spirochaetia bacterium]|nr:AraC family ligand binding domain-containing protein [Spirochaetia bacterium]
MQKTTIRQVPLDKPELFRVRILFLNVVAYHRAGKIAPHSHDHWQMEVVRKGRARIVLASASFELKTGDLFLIAPGDRHHFEYPPSGCECVSVKFSLSPKKPHPGSGLFSGGKWSLALKHGLAGLLPNAAGEWTDDELGSSLLSHQIASVMEIFHRPRDPVSPRVNLEKSIRTLIETSEGRPL